MSARVSRSSARSASDGVSDRCPSSPAADGGVGCSGCDGGAGCACVGCACGGDGGDGGVAGGVCRLGRGLVGSGVSASAWVMRAGRR